MKVHVNIAVSKFSFVCEGALCSKNCSFTESTKTPPLSGNSNPA
uniref:Uncharacterized protein n=1 Tax=Anguilla anguilla TaxID=7936 RepID=A0A0E9VK20_ANGAN